MCNISIAPKDDIALEIIRSKGINIVCAGLSANSVDLSSFNCSAPFILFIGGEKRGISQTFFENADTVCIAADVLHRRQNRSAHDRKHAA